METPQTKLKYILQNVRALQQTNTISSGFSSLGRAPD